MSYTQPHEAYQSVPEYWDRDADTDIALPEIPEDDGPLPVTERLKIHHGIDRFAPDGETIRLSRRACYAMISHLDDYLGELVAELKHLGLYDDTVIVFTSDHGDMLGERGMWFKRTFFEGSLKVPLIVHAPARFRAGRVNDCVALADLCPTLAELGGALEVSDRHGSPDSASFLSLLTRKGDSRRNEAIAEYWGPGVIEPWLAIRRGPWKHVWTRNHPDLLYNVENDPHEQTDLSRDPAQAGVKTELRERLLGRYDVEAVTQRAVQSKTTRMFLQSALAGSEGYRLDYQPLFDASRQYVRGINSPSTA